MFFGWSRAGNKETKNIKGRLVCNWVNGFVAGPSWAVGFVRPKLKMEMKY